MQSSLFKNEFKPLNKPHSKLWLSLEFKKKWDSDLSSVWVCFLPGRGQPAKSGPCVNSQSSPSSAPIVDGGNPMMSSYSVSRFAVHGSLSDYKWHHLNIVKTLGHQGHDTQVPGLGRRLGPQSSLCKPRNLSSIHRIHTNPWHSGKIYMGWWNEKDPYEPLVARVSYMVSAKPMRDPVQ